MTQGSNAPLSAVRVSVEVTCRQRVDVSGLLLTAAGKVRSDADLVFFNAPRGPGVTHRPAGGSTPDAITVDTWAVPADVSTIVITASLDEAGATFAGTEPTATIKDADTGQVIAEFTPPRLSRETALVVVEVYRRGAEWKVRAVGQGYANGLAGIATDFGVSIEEPGPAAVPPMPGYAPTLPLMPSAPAAPPVPAAPPAPAAPPVASGQPGQGGPGGPGGQGGPAAAPKVTLDKGRVSLVKGGSVSLVKGGRPLLSSIRMALGWEPAKRGRNVDLDASCIAFDAKRERLETAWFMKLNIFNGAIQHTGDNLTGGGAGDDEAIEVHLEGLPPEVCGLVFVVNSFSGQRFTEVTDAYCRLLDVATGEELVRFDLTNAQPHTGVVMCKLVRQYSGEWVMTALGEFVDAKTARGMVKPAAALL
ncbi:TerD family protein [Kitasatospora sp. NBC_01287]|uniref:TerD family protein n=1 Tax=Kitasatospora sp. NBC_01287 TaxID=2903573 RepID=UPI0022583892|nr:TerD family protein [Kitasatospora sp. NBC_01287]MCX4746205.1 TerD family protein [Kitasatospora sp. NBC_01287]